MANYSDLTTMFKLRHWFEFEDNSDLGLDSITNETMLSIQNVSQSSFKQDPDIIGFPTVGQGLLLPDQTQSQLDSSIDMIDFSSILNTGQDSLAATLLFNFIDNDYDAGNLNKYNLLIINIGSVSIRGVIHRYNDDVSIRITTDNGAASLSISEYIPIDVDSINSITFSLKTENKYNNERDFNDNTGANDKREYEEIMTIPGAASLVATISSEYQRNLDSIIDIYDSSDNIIYSCTKYTKLIDTVSIPGDTARVVVRARNQTFVQAATHVSITDQDGNKGTPTEVNTLQVFLDGTVISEVEVQFKPSDITSMSITNNIPLSDSPIDMYHFPGKISELIFTDALPKNEIFRLHSILKGLFDTDTLKSVAEDNNAFIWHKFTNGIKEMDNNSPSFYGFDEIHKVRTENSFNIYPYVRSKEYDYSLSCPYAFFNPRAFKRVNDNYSLGIGTRGWTVPVGNSAIVDIERVQYSTFMVHLQPEDSDTSVVNGTIFYVGNSNYYVKIIVMDLGPDKSHATLRFMMSNVSHEVDLSFDKALPVNSPFVVYLGVDANLIHLMIDGKTYVKDTPTNLGINDYWYNIFRYDRALMIQSREFGSTGEYLPAPSMGVSDYIFYELPLEESEIRKIASIYHAGDPSYTIAETDSPTFKTAHYQGPTNHRLNLSNETDRGLDMVTGKRIPITFSGNRYESIPGFPGREGIVMDGDPNQRRCIISQIMNDGDFSTRVRDIGYMNNSNAINQPFNVGVYVYHDDVSRINMLRWSGAVDPDKNWLEVEITADGFMETTLSINGHIDKAIKNTGVNFGLNSFFVSIGAEVASYFEIDIQILFADVSGQSYTTRNQINLSTAGVTTEYILDEVVKNSTLEIGGGPNINKYMNSNYNMSGIISDIFIFAESNIVQNTRFNKALNYSSDESPISQHQDRSRYNTLYGKGTSTAGMKTKSNPNGPSPGEDRMPLSGTMPALIVSETNKYSSPVITMRPIVDVKVTDGFADTSFSGTYLVPIPSCSSVDLTILKLQVDTEANDGGNKVSISDGTLNREAYWDNSEAGYPQMWPEMRYYNSGISRENPFCPREGIIYDFIKYNGKIVFSFLARYIETNKNTSYGDANNHHNEDRGKRLYHYNHVGYIEPTIFGNIKNSFKYFDDGSNGELGILRANRNNGFIHLAANNQPHSFMMNNFADRLARASDYDPLCQLQPFECSEAESNYGGEYF